MALTAKQIEELNVAAARRDAGKASATDTKNLDYAEKTQSYKYMPNTNTAISPPPVNSVTVDKWKTGASPQNSTLSGIAGANNTSVDELMKLNPSIKNPNLIYPGQNINLPGTAGGSGVPDYSQVDGIESANQAINAEQDADIASGTESDDPETRKTAEDYSRTETSQYSSLENIQPEGGRPEADFSEMLKGYRGEYGVVDLESQLNELRSAEEELEATKRLRTQAEEGKTVAMNVITGRVGEAERQENERIDAVQRQIRNVTNQLNTKYDVINTLMKTEELDYQNAVENYDAQMKTNMAMYEAAKTVEEKALEAENEAAGIESVEDTSKIARSNAQIMLNSLQEYGLGWDDISDAQKSQLAKLGVESGLGADFFSMILKAQEGGEVLTLIDAPGKTDVTIVYKDGKTKRVSGGLVKGIATGTTTAAKEAQKRTDAKADAGSGDQDKVSSFVESVTGSDGKTNPEEMAWVYEDIKKNKPELLEWFESTYQPKDYLNVKYYPKAVKANSWEIAVEENKKSKGVDTPKESNIA